MEVSYPSLEGTSASNRTAGRILLVLHYAYPILLLFFFLSVFTAHGITAASNSNSNKPKSTILGPGGKPLPSLDPTRGTKKKESKDDIPRHQKLMFEWISIITTITFLANTVNVIVHAIYSRKDSWWCGQSVVIYIVGSFFVFSLVVLSLFDSQPSPTWAHLSSWILALLMEVVLLGASLAVYTRVHREPHAGKDIQVPIRRHMTEWEAIEVSIDLIRILLVATLVGFYILFVVFRKTETGEDAGPSETTGLLAGGPSENGHANGYGYGSAPVGGKHQHTEGAPAGWVRPTTVPSRSWWEYLRGYSVFFPYLWPAKDRKLQVAVVLCFVIVIIQRGINLLVPIQVGKITDELAGENGPIRMPWASICLYILYRLLQGTNGLLGATRAVMWIPVSQYSYRELSVAAFEHVHSLSLEFHLGKRTGEVLSALGKGNSINTFLEQVTFSVVPMLIDLIVAVAYFLIVFDAYYALVIAIVTFWYVYLTIRMAQWRAEMRRQMVNADREEDAVKNDSMVSYETVKYFNAEAYEFNRYRDAVKKYQQAEYKVLYSLSFMNVTQNAIFVLGLMVACFIAAFQVTTHQRKVGMFVTLLTYMAQLQQPLNFFGTFYRMIQSAMINSERLLELFKEQPTVVDNPGASVLPSCEGHIRFNDVQFAYDARKPALNGLDFECAPGSTTALVGESGGGKSTVFRLLFRFYNASGGNIQVDGHDVEDVTIDSLRRHIGVVPQDTVLFNESVMYNLKYANPNAEDEDVYSACRAASIHEKILSFPDGYNTKVGERGLRLSGGEKQRVAIARTILKNPRIILLDEATAALDTETEEHIQEALTTLSQGRTMLVIAHRLSTIVRADQILVLHEGKVAERGTHDELLAKKGRYNSMWKKQVKAQKAAEEAKALKDIADRLRRESTSKDASVDSEESASHSEDDDRERERAQDRPATTEDDKGVK
ncbi:heavy metal tolerance protein precursor [Patellaria atrata CBS 101060]|uniref:Heavy metal tolerance protein n=1 Tax=Patellaria atrata CBS 101060 TaxID=1346257 RepID=A0A9P4SG65_9PEZI|nr:heavy metal tolerance protein precursor [Patellaria atrata CBS 101060]